MHAGVAIAGGQMERLVRAVDWASTPLGPPSAWPEGLCAALAILLESAIPMYLAWGSELVQFYNEAFRLLLGASRPLRLGRSARESFAAEWETLGPLLAEARLGRGAVLLDTPLLAGPAERYHTCSFSPAPPDGVLLVLTDTTSRVVPARRLHALRSLCERTRDCPSGVLACQLSAETLAECADLPFVAVYLLGEDRQRLVLAAQGGRCPALPGELAPAGPWPVAEILASGRTHPVELDTRRARLLPLRGPQGAMGLLLAGMSERLSPDEGYEGFLELAAAQVASALAVASAPVMGRPSSLRLVQDVLQQLPSGVVITDTEGHVTMTNDRARKLLGEKVQEAGQFLGNVQPNERMMDREFELLSADHRVRKLLASAAPVRDHAGNVVAAVSVVTDITERARAEQLERQARAAAEVANRSKDEFLAMLGHELRNPLTPILTALHLMQFRGQGVFERERALIERQVGHLMRLVDDLLDVSRITRGKVELRRQRIQMSELVGKALELASPLLEQRQHKLTLEVPLSGLLVDVDPVRLAQVIANLLNNAAKYTEPRGAIQVRAWMEGQQVALSIQDTGIGLAEDILPYIFDLFVQSRQALDRAQGGLGLGLAIVRTLVEAHGGAVSAHSAGPGQGSEFVVRLPLAQGADTPSDVPRLYVAPHGGCRVLVVDDNVDAVEMLAECLRDSGHTVVTAHDGPRALRVAEEFCPEVAVLDIGLPAMDGYELARLLKRMPQLQDLRLIALTGYGQELDRRYGQEAGFESWLVKPVHYEELEELLHKRGPKPAVGQRPA
jgi:signal transduction histidine kinase/ActR/RegA family two-component response regulator